MPINSAFIITKPIQLLMTLAILKQEKFHTNIIIYFCDSFYDAENVECRFKQEVKGQIITYFCKTRIEAINFAAHKNLDNLYLDSDVGVQHYIALTGFKLRNLFCRISIFEEGLGTYRVDSYTGVMKLILRMFGVGSNYGDYIFTSHIYLYKPVEYLEKFRKQRNKTIQIENSIWSVIEDNKKLLNKTFGINLNDECFEKRKICYIYLTGHSIDNKFLEHFKNIEGALFIKYHPHIKKHTDIEGVKILYQSAPIECILHELIVIYKNIVIYDHESASRRYVSDSRIKFKSIQDNIQIDAV